jgi:RNA polymerase sigma factor (sigma-70 family)
VTIQQMTEGIQNGDEAAFELFHNLYSDRMHRYLLVALHGDEELARDLLQEVLLRVVRYMKPLPADENLWRYLAALMRSAMFDHHRRAKTSRKVLDTAQQMAALDSGLSEDAALDRMRESLEHAMQTLSDDDRKLLEARYYDERSLQDLSGNDASLAKSLSVKLHRLRQHLRDMLLRGLSNG